MGRNKCLIGYEVIACLFLFLASSCGKNTSDNINDKNLVGNWRVTQIAVKTGNFSPNSTTGDIITTFSSENTRLNFTNGNFSGEGDYLIISKGYEIKVNVSRTDTNTTASSDFLNLFLSNINEARTYQLYASGYTIFSTTTALTLTTKDSVKLYFQKL